MGAITYKCPACGGELVFDPASQQYRCPYCGSLYTQAQLDVLHPSEGQTYAVEEDTQSTSSAQAQHSGKEADSEDAVLYSCPSCGAEIVTSATTAATFCYYCHNPVVLKGRLSGEFLPDSVITFQIDRAAAKEKLVSFIKRKKFVPKAFFDESQIEKLTGVYYPYWIYDARVEGDIEAKGTKVHVMRVRDEEVTETSIYQVLRGGVLDLFNLTRNALGSDQRELVENVQPYNLNDEAVKDFHMSYLSGFQAERRNMEKDAFQEDLRGHVVDYAEMALRNSIEGYTTVTPQGRRLKVTKEHWRYVLLPVWVMTYRNGSDKTFYYALNAQTGEAAGKLPLDYKKLGLVSLLSGALVSTIVLAICFFL